MEKPLNESIFEGSMNKVFKFRFKFMGKNLGFSKIGDDTGTYGFKTPKLIYRNESGEVATINPLEVYYHRAAFGFYYKSYHWLM